MNTLIAWVRQPTTIQGASVIFGTLSAALAGQVTWAHAAPLLLGGALAIVAKDNSSTILHQTQANAAAIAAPPDAKPEVPSPAITKETSSWSAASRSY